MTALQPTVAIGLAVATHHVALSRLVIIALSEAAKDVVYFRKKLSGIDPKYVTSPTPTSTDNKGAHDLSYNPEFHNRTKHIARRHFYVRDMVESLEIEVPFVRTADNIADFFTHPAKSPAQFRAHRRKIMNERD